MERKKVFGGIVALLLCLLFVLFILNRGPEPVAAFSPQRFSGHVLVIDAGHGGEDGGAVSFSGVKESTINLEISQKLNLIAGFWGANTVMLRSSDVSLHDDSAKTLHEKKVSDLNHRISVIESHPDAVLISVHQNSFTNQKYSGAQVFYAGTEGSSLLGDYTQEVLRQSLDPGNTRQAARISNSVYLMSHISCPAILVECGFLTNPAEDAMLQNDSYQKKIAAALAGSYLQYLQMTTP